MSTPLHTPTASEPHVARPLAHPDPAKCDRSICAVCQRPIERRGQHAYRHRRLDPRELERMYDEDARYDAAVEERERDERDDS